MKILFIAYFFKPYPNVGAKRLTYWYEKFKKNNEHEIIVLTASKQNLEDVSIKYIPPSEKFNYLNFFIKDEGLNWIKPLKKYLKEIKGKLHFDYILISGGPFMHMILTKYIKRYFSSKIILDFRDPFYKNPRFNNSFFKDSIKQVIQNFATKYSDIIITVNQYCAANINHKNIYLINNGFDERILSDLPKVNSFNPNYINLMSIGRIDDDFNITDFSYVLNNCEKMLFHYIGSSIRQSEVNNNFILYGTLDYETTLAYLNNADICILFTGGRAFESTTKIFDYLALNKKILIITNGEIETGSLYEITKNNLNVMWAQNNKESIKSSIKRLFDSDLHTNDIMQYSRLRGYEELCKILKENTNSL